jgi:hypothetical protein
VARNHARAADVSQKAEERAAAAVATSVATAGKGLAVGSWAERVSFLHTFLSLKMFLMRRFHQ